MEIKPFGFNRSFELTNAQVGGELSDDLLAEVATMRATLAQLRSRHAEALLEARLEGFEAGRVRASAESASALLAATDALHAALDDIDARLSDQTRAIHSDAVDFALLAAEMLAGHAVDFAPARGVDEALGRALEQVARGTALVIRIHPNLADGMAQRLETRIAQERRKLDLTLVPDESIAPGDGQISWNEGGLVIDAAKRREALMAELIPLMETDHPGTKD